MTEVSCCSSSQHKRSTRNPGTLLWSLLRWVMIYWVLNVARTQWLIDVQAKRQSGKEEYELLDSITRMYRKSQAGRSNKGDWSRGFCFGNMVWRCLSICCQLYNTHGNEQTSICMKPRTSSRAHLILHSFGHSLHRKESNDAESCKYIGTRLEAYPRIVLRIWHFAYELYSVATGR